MHTLKLWYIHTSSDTHTHAEYTNTNAFINTVIEFNRITFFSASSIHLRPWMKDDANSIETVEKRWSTWILSEKTYMNCCAHLSICLVPCLLCARAHAHKHTHEHVIMYTNTNVQRLPSPSMLNVYVVCMHWKASSRKQYTFNVCT